MQVPWDTEGSRDDNEENEEEEGEGEKGQEEAEGAWVGRLTQEPSGTITEPQSQGLSLSNVRHTNETQFALASAPGLFHKTPMV